MKIELLGESGGTIRLGQMVILRCTAPDEKTELRVFVRHGPVRYLTPLFDWTRQRELPIYLEAPGRYVLVVQWRSATGAGREEVALHVERGGGEDRPGPARVQIGEGATLWAPSRWDAHVLEAAERGVLAALREQVRPGDTVYDVGANLGVYALHFSDWVGATGRVYCVEANPVCVSYLQGSVAASGRTNVDVLPIALLDQPGEVEFAIHYANTNIGLTASSGFYASKLGHRIRVACTSLDLLIAEHELAAPAVIKLDIEGAEAFALRGMRETLARHRPFLALELHGATHASASFVELDALGYRYRAPSGSRFASSAEVLEAFGNTVFQILAEAS